MHSTLISYTARLNLTHAYFHWTAWLSTRKKPTFLWENNKTWPIKTTPMNCSKLEQPYLLETINIALMKPKNSRWVKSNHITFAESVTHCWLS